MPDMPSNAEVISFVVGTIFALVLAVIGNRLDRFLSTREENQRAKIKNEIEEDAIIVKEHRDWLFYQLYRSLILRLTMYVGWGMISVILALLIALWNSLNLIQVSLIVTVGVVFLFTVYRSRKQDRIVFEIVKRAGELRLSQVKQDK